LTETPPAPRPSFRQQRGLSKAAWNERLKLFATSLNAVGLTVLALGVIGPFVTGQPVSGVRFLGSCAIFLAFHVAAHWALRWLED
jgi:hypothetical protein